MQYRLLPKSKSIPIINYTFIQLIWILSYEKFKILFLFKVKAIEDEIQEIKKNNPQIIKM